MEKNKFSVIVPVYNAQKYIKRCAASILAQAYPNFEIIFVDDGSTDASGEICEKYAAKYDCCKVVHQENKGIAATRNTGLREADGEFICFVDSDDYIEKELLHKAYEVLQEGIDIVSFGARRVDERERYLYEMRFENMITSLALNEENRDRIFLTKFLQYEMGWEACFQVFRTSLLRENQILFSEDLNYGEDLIFSFQALLYADSWKKIPDILYDYTMREDSLSVQNGTQRMIEGVKKFRQKIKSCLIQKDPAYEKKERLALYDGALLYYFNGLLEKTKETKRIHLGTAKEETDLYQMLESQKKELESYFGTQKAEDIRKRLSYLKAGGR